MRQHARGLHVSMVALGIAGALAASDAAASGFQLREDSVKASGSASAGAASAKGDAAVVSNNPALMTTFTRKTVQVDGSVVDLRFKFKGNTCAAGSAYNAGSYTCDQYIGGNDNKGGNAGGLNAVPAMAVVVPLPLHDNLEGFALGASISAPFGLKTDYDADWTGRYFATLSDVKVIDATFSAAANIGDHFSVGLGLIAEYMKVTLGERIDFASGACNQANGLLPGACALLPLLYPGTPNVAAHEADGTEDGSAQVSGDDVAFGWNAGIDWRPTDTLSIGLDYRPGIKHKLKGSGNFIVPANMQNLLDSAAPGQYADGGGGANFTVPRVATASVTWEATPKLSLMAEFQRTGWSSLQEIRIHFDDVTLGDGSVVSRPDQVENYDWHDSNYFALGAEYKLTGNFTLRTGIGFDQSPISNASRTRTLDYNDDATVTDTYRTPRLPDENRRIYALGLSWNPSWAGNWEFDMDWEHVQIAKTPTVDLVSGESGQGARLLGEFTGSADVVGIAASVGF